jgi:hypothetical protein
MSPFGALRFGVWTARFGTIMAANVLRLRARHHDPDSFDCTGTGKTLSSHSCRSVAQPGSASDLGSEGRRFESFRSDHVSNEGVTSLTRDPFAFSGSASMFARVTAAQRCRSLANSRYRLIFCVHPSYSYLNFISGPSMPRFAALLLCSLLLSACADATVPHHTPPQDPPDYKGVPTDTTPPVMIIAPAKPEQPQ